MPIPPKFLAEFFENNIYHIYNKTNNNEPLFLNEENYFFFLKKYDEYLSPFLDTFCWNLLPNHFHLMVRIKSHEEICKSIISKEIKQITLTEKLFLQRKFSVNGLLGKTFTRFFQCYAQSFNKMHERKGNLFYKPFKRIVVSTDSQFTQAMIYIHANALKHGLVKDFTKHKWSSWHSIISSKPTKLLRNETLDWFGNKESFVKAHFDLSHFYYDNDPGSLDD